MRSEWEEVQLKDYIDIKHGYAYKGENFSKEQTDKILLTPGNFSVGGGFKKDKLKFYSLDADCPEEYILNSGDLVVTMTDLSKKGDTLGYAALVPDDENIYLHNQRVGLIHNVSKLLSVDFLYWLMRSQKYQNHVVSFSTGSTVKHTSPSLIKQYNFTLPPLPTQKAIADTLSCLDAKIEINNKINANLEAQAQAIFKS